MELPLRKLSVIIRSPHDKSDKTQSTHLGVEKADIFMAKPLFGGLSLA